MATYIIAALIAVLFVLAVRSYFGKKYGNGCQGGCASCPYTNKCHTPEKIKD